MPMELKIYNPQDGGFLEKIDWNYEELKAQIISASQDYEAMIYNDDSIRVARADRAKLNKFVNALSSKRTEIRKQLLKPDEQFGREVKELTGIVEKAIKNIDSQIVNYEKRQREEKIAKVRNFYDENIGDLEEYLPFERIMKPEYANISMSMKAIKEGLLGDIQKVSEGFAILNEVDSKYAADMKAMFLRTYDIGAAMAERNRLEEAERVRTAYEEEQKRLRIQEERDAAERTEAARVMAAGRPAAQESARTAPEVLCAAPAQQTKIETVEEPVNIIDFRVYATMAQLMKLKGFLKDNGIRFEPVPKE